MKNKFKLVAVASLSITMFSCDDSENDTVVDTSKDAFIASISDTSWKKECFPVYIDSSLVAHNNTTISISSSLQSTTKVKMYDSTDTECNSIVENITFKTQLEITDKIISEESIEAYGVDVSFIESADIPEFTSSYSLIYVDSERLYYGIDSGSNLGLTRETRHSSISLDDYLEKVVN